MKCLNTEEVEDIVNFWGDKMPMLVMEEAGELIQAISKYERGIENREQKLIDEIGDMYISLLAIRLYYGLDLQKIEKRIENKLNKNIGLSFFSQSYSIIENVSGMEEFILLMGLRSR